MTTLAPASPTIAAILQDWSGLGTPPASDIVVDGWVTEPNARGTWSLLYSCLFTILLCIWTALHANIPHPREGRFSAFWKKIQLTLLALVFPEWALYLCALQLQRARALKEFLNHETDREGWSKEVLRETEEARQHVFPRRIGEGVLRPTETPIKFSLRYCFYVVMGGFVVTRSGANGRSFAVLDEVEVRALAEDGLYLVISEGELSAKGKADWLAKGLAICQICWLAVQCVGRARAHLLVSLLEVHTLVHVCSAMAMFSFWWSKPKDIEAATLIDCSAVDGDHISARILESDWWQHLWEEKAPQFRLRAPNLVERYDNKAATLPVFTLSIAFAIVHLLVTPQWGAHGHYFPSHVEAVLWATSGYLLLVGSSILLIMDFVDSYCIPGMNDSALSTSIFAIFLFLGLVARLFLMGESLASLRAPSVQTFLEPSWTAYLPHF